MGIKFIMLLNILHFFNLSWLFYVRLKDSGTALKSVTTVFMNVPSMVTFRSVASTDLPLAFDLELLHLSDPLHLNFSLQYESIL